MSSLKLVFPPSRTCLWDSTPSGETTELSMTKDGWLLVQVSSSCLQLALNYAKSHSSKTIDCFLIATSWINEAESITVEVDRFDPGRLNKERTISTPTSLISGDIVVKTQIVLGSHPDSKYLTHNLITLGDTLDEMTQSLSLHDTTPLDPTSLLSLRMHCACTQDGAATLRCGCVMPAQVYQATPISSIPIVSTALARNLSGPLPLSALQGRTKHGYITMDSSRKIVLLLHSDPIVSSIPLVGVWVSGVGSVHHPLVWAACMAYTHSTALRDRVWGSKGEEEEKEGGTFLTLVYYEGCTQPSFWEFQVKKTPEGADLPPFNISTGETEVQFPTEHSMVGLALAPAGESTAMHTLLETTLATSSSSSPRAGPKAPVPLTAPFTSTASPSTAVATSTQVAAVTASSSALDADSGEESMLALSPLPSCLPTPTQAPERIVRDKNLSVISSLSAQPDSPRESVSSNGGGTAQGSGENELMASQSTTPLDGTAGSGGTLQQQTTPTSHVTSPSIHMALEDHQNQLKALAEQVRCIFESQSSGSVPSPVATRGTPTVDAATSTGASLWSPSLPPRPSPQGSGGGISNRENARVVEKDFLASRPTKKSGDVVMGSFGIPVRPTPGDGGSGNSEDAGGLDTFSLRTATTSMCSHDTTNGHVHVDLHSYVGESYVSEGLGESASVSLPYDLEQQTSTQLFPLTPHLCSADAVDGEMLAGIEERLKTLLQMQAKRDCSVPKGSPLERSSGCSSLQGLVYGGKERGGRHGGSGGGSLVVEDGHSRRDFADVSMSSYSRQSSTAAATKMGSGSSSLNPQQRWRDEGRSAGSGGEDDSSDKTPTPPHHSDDSSSDVVTPPSNMAPSLPNMTPPQPHMAPYHHHHPQPPFVTPLSTRTGHHLLHPDVLLHQQDISMLPVPHILCPSAGSSDGGGGGDGLSFAAVLGNDYTLDENVHMADIIALKYLDMPTSSSGSSSAKTSESRRRNGGNFFADEASTDSTLNMSMATQQYLQRYNLLGPGCAKRVGVCSPVLEGQSEEDASPPPLNPTLDIQALKTLRNKLAHLSDSGTK